jgi:hypothetical protein
MEGSDDIPGNRLVYCPCCDQMITSAAARNHREGKGVPAAAASALLGRNRAPSPKIAGARRPDPRPAKKRRKAAPANEGGAGSAPDGGTGPEGTHVRYQV